MTRLFYTSSVDRFDPEREHLVTYTIGCHLTIDDAEEAVHLAAARLDTLETGKGPWAALPRVESHIFFYDLHCNMVTRDGGKV